MKGLAPWQLISKINICLSLLGYFKEAGKFHGLDTRGRAIPSHAAFLVPCQRTDMRKVEQG